MLQTARQPFDDVKLGPLLGKGGFGRVYRAVWNGAAVACKVDQFLKHSCFTSPSLLFNYRQVENACAKLRI